MAITRSTPVAISSDYASNKPALANVTIPADALCVVFVTSTSAFSSTLIGTANATIADSGSHTWTLRAAGYDNNNNDGYASAVWVYEWFNNTGASVTTTITTDFSAIAYNPGAAVVAQILTGAKDPSTYTPQVVTTTVQSLPQVSITPTYAGSQIIAGFMDRGGTALVTAVSGSVIDTSPAAQTYSSALGLVTGTVARASTESTRHTRYDWRLGAERPEQPLYMCCDRVLRRLCNTGYC